MGQIKMKERLAVTDLVSSGPVERGFYVACGQRAMAEQVLDRMVDVLAREERSAGWPDTAPWQPRSHRRASHIGQMIWIDTDGSFDSATVAQAAHRRGLNPARALRAIKVWRTETLLSFSEALARVPNAALAAFPSTAEEENLPYRTIFSRSTALGLFGGGHITQVREPNAVWWTPLIVVGNLYAPFHSPESEAEQEWAFRELWLRLSHLRERAVVLGLHRHNAGEAGAPRRLTELLALARRVYAEPIRESEPAWRSAEPAYSLAMARA